MMAPLKDIGQTPGQCIYFVDVATHVLDICIYPVGCRDLYVVIKINTLEEVSSLLEHVI